MVCTCFWSCLVWWWWFFDQPLQYIRLVWTPCLMHRCVCIWWYILHNYNYKLHFQNLFIYDIPHVSIGTLAAENLDVCIACDLWDSNIQLTMGIDWRRQIYPNIEKNNKRFFEINVSLGKTQNPKHYSNFCFFLFASPNPNPKFTAYHICDPSATSQNKMCTCTYSLCWL